MNLQTLSEALVELERMSAFYASQYGQVKFTGRHEKYATLIFARGTPIDNDPTIKTSPELTQVVIGSSKTELLSAHQRIDRHAFARKIIEQMKIVTDIIGEHPMIGHDRLNVEVAFSDGPKTPRLQARIDGQYILHAHVSLDQFLEGLQSRLDDLPAVPNGSLMLEWRVEDAIVHAPTAGAAVCKYFAFTSYEFAPDLNRQWLPCVSRPASRSDLLEEIKQLRQA